MTEEQMIEDILKHLDSEVQAGVVRMSVEMDDESSDKTVSHKCCKAYGKSANETVAGLDQYTDTNAGRPDNEK